MHITKLTGDDNQPAMELVWEVFSQFEAPAYSPQGIERFADFIHNRQHIDTLCLYGAWHGAALTGVLATNQQGSHISLLFVRASCHRQGIGRALFARLLADFRADPITVNSSPYAVAFYRRLGFVPECSEQLADGIRFTPMRYHRHRE